MEILVKKKKEFLTRNPVLDLVTKAFDVGNYEFCYQFDIAIYKRYVTTSLYLVHLFFASLAMTYHYLLKLTK